MKYEIIAWLIFSVIASSCSTCVDGPALYVRGEVDAMLDENGTFVKYTGKKRPTRELQLPSSSDTLPVASFEPFRLRIPETLDLGTRSLKIESVNDVQTGLKDKGDRLFRISLVDACQPVIELNDSCQTINWYNPFRLPQIFVKNGRMEQVIATPLIVNKSMVGYEIRLGDKQVCGCPSKALGPWKAYYQGKVHTLKPIRSTKEQPAVPEFLLTAKD